MLYSTASYMSRNEGLAICIIGCTWSPGSASVTSPRRYAGYRAGVTNMVPAAFSDDSIKHDQCLHIDNYD